MSHFTQCSLPPSLAAFAEIDFFVPVSSPPQSENKYSRSQKAPFRGEVIKVALVIANVITVLLLIELWKRSIFGTVPCERQLLFLSSVALLHLFHEVNFEFEV